MTKRYTILQKRLKELESALNQVFALPPETPYHQRFSQDIQHRFLFLKNLLSAEIASRPRKPYHLQHIARRLLELEAVFQEWDSFQTPIPDHVEKGSTCSCTESCLNDDGEAAEGSPQFSLAGSEEVAEASTELGLAAGLDLEGFDEDRIVPLPLQKDQNLETTREERICAEAERSMIRKQVTNGVWFLGALASGVVLGMVLMASLMVRLSGCFHHANDYSVCLSPT